MLQRFKQLDKKKKLMILFGSFALVFIFTVSSVGAIYLIIRDNGESSDSSSQGDGNETITDTDNEEGREQDVADGGDHDSEETDSDENDDETGESDTTTGDTIDTEDEQTGSDDDNTPSDEGNDTEDSQSNTQPAFTEVVDTMNNVDSYKLDVTTVYDQMSIEAYYSSPDRERVIETEGEIVSEEIKIGDNYYARTDGGAWESIPEAVLTDFHDEFFTEILSLDTDLNLGGEKNGDWLYSMTMDGMNMEIFVEKETNYVHKVNVSAEGVTAIIMIFSEYGENFSITAPI